MYKIEFGTFVEVADKNQRPFLPVFSEIIQTKEELVKRLQLFIPYWKESLFENWMHRPERPRTFLMGEIHGYRITELN